MIGQEKSETIAVTGRDMRSEDMFLAWVMQLPHAADIAAAARIEIARLDAINSDSETIARLRSLLVQASASRFAMPRGRSRSKH